MTWTVEDLGPVSWGDTCLHNRAGRDPVTGAAVVFVALSRGGMIVIDPYAQTGRQVGPPKLGGPWWAVSQAPDGSVWQVECSSGKSENHLVRWDGQGEQSSTVAHPPGKVYFTLDIAPDGRVYMPEYTSNVMHVYHPATGEFSELTGFAPFGQHIRNVGCADDGWVYVTATDHDSTCVVAISPTDGSLSTLNEGDAVGLRIDAMSLLHSADGRVLLAATRWGRQIWFEARNGSLHAIDQQGAVAAHQGVVAWPDGSYIEKIEEKNGPRPAGPDGELDVVFIDPHGKRTCFTVPRQGQPLRLFSVTSALGKIWAGTFIPLTLASYDPATGERMQFGNPTQTNGEIYTMIESHQKLYMGSYCGAVFTRFDPARPWRREKAAGDNPAHLGAMRDERILQRPYGVAKDAAGRVFFAAMGGYGVLDSGICRINPANEDFARFIYQDTTFTVLCYLDSLNQLLVGENRLGEEAIRFTFISPDTGEVLHSEPMIHDQGQVNAWLYDGADTVYGLHAWRATLFAYSLAQRKITRQIEEMRFGNHCDQSLMFGPDGRIWGLTGDAVWSADPDLTEAREVVRYPSQSDGNFYRFGMCLGPDGHVYFPNGPHLMRVVRP